MVYSKLTYMLLRQFRLGSNLPTHIKENIDFLPQKPRKLSSTISKADIYIRYR